MADPKPRAVLYARVSTKDKGQDPTNQLIPLRTMARTRGWKIVDEIIEHESAAGSKTRKQFVQMLRRAESHEFDVVAFWSLDRFSREGVTQTLFDLRKLSDVGVDWVSCQEEFLDSTLLGPFREVVIALIAAIAKLETERRSERSKAAIERKRAAGQHVGNKRRDLDEKLLAAMAKDKYSRGALARFFNVSRGTIINRLKEIDAKGGIE